MRSLSPPVTIGARSSRAILGDFAERSRKLAGLCAAVGLAQNLGALRALCAEGIQRGHMRLHARQVALAAGAQAHEVKTIAAALVEKKDVRLALAKEILGQVRRGER